MREQGASEADAGRPRSALRWLQAALARLEELPADEARALAFSGCARHQLLEQARPAPPPDLA